MSSAAKRKEPTADEPAPSAAGEVSDLDVQVMSFKDKLSFYYASSNTFLHREFALVLEDDVYLRYRCYAKNEDWVKDLCQKVPVKIDIGPTYSHPPVRHNNVDPSRFKPTQRELIIDIDLTDYDDVRICCEGAKICPKCWAFMPVAVDILDRALREDFGFKHIMWVFSGRRGIHGWVCDERARYMSDSTRSAVAQYLQVYAGENARRKSQVNLTQPLHPSLERAKEVLEKAFADIVIEKQGMFDSDKGREIILKVLPESVNRDDVIEAFETSRESSPEKRYAAFKAAVTPKKQSGFSDPLDEVLFTLLYPRLDINVSKTMNHLLKSPFCVHPKTGNVCVPIDRKKVHEFDPFSVPTLDKCIAQVLAHYNAMAVAPDRQTDKSQDFRFCDLQECVESVFERQFCAPLAQEGRSKKQRDIAVKNDEQSGMEF